MKFLLKKWSGVFENDDVMATWPLTERKYVTVYFDTFYSDIA